MEPAARTTQTAEATQVDEWFIGQWLDFGFREMGAFLDRHARFARYLDERGRLPAD